MQDVNLQSSVLRLNDFPRETKKIMIMIDQRGWAIRCYNEAGEKLTTMVKDERLGDSESDATLVPREQLNM